MLNVFSRKSKKSPLSQQHNDSNKRNSHPSDEHPSPSSVLTSHLPSPTGSTHPPPLFPVFGVPLPLAVDNSRSYDSPRECHLPLVIRLCVDYLELHGGLETEGIYRVSPSKQRLDDLEALVNGENVVALEFSDAHEAAGLLKRFLIRMPEHVLSEGLRERLKVVALGEWRREVSF